MNADANQDRNFTDCRAGLIVFGVFEVLIGGLCALMIPMMAFAMLAATKLEEAGGINAQMMLPGMLVYVLIAAWFIWLGIGSAMCRRWARTILLVTSWMALVFGAIGTAFWLYISPEFYAATAEQQGVDANMLEVMRIVTTAFMFAIYVIGPVVFVTFYGNRHVRATCEVRDPKERWTDRCPPQVQALVYLFALWGISFLSMFFYKCAVPCFGTVLTGAAGTVATTVVAAAGLWVAWGLYRLRPSAWWAGLALTVVIYPSTGVTFSRITMMEYYERMGFPPDQAELIGAMNMEQDPVMIGLMVTWLVVFVGYFLYTRRYFVTQRQDVKLS